MRPRGTSVIAALAAAFCLLAAGTAAARRAEQVPSQAPAKHIVLQWYDITDRTVTSAAFPEPITRSRTWAVSWLAAARAVGDSDDPGYTTAAFARALHDTLAAQVPGQRSQLDAELAATLAGIRDDAARRAGVAAGRRAARTVLAQRHGDGTDTASLDIPYTPPPPAPQVWRPTPPAYGPATGAGQGSARPFLLAAGGQFDPGPPPGLSSRTYLTSLAEVRALGGTNSAVRTPAQTDTARFWYPALDFAYGQILRAVLAGTSHSLRWDTTFVAAFHAITTDAQIAVFNTKFTYVSWRPVTAIREGGIQPDPDWTPLMATPRFPEYVSGHAGVAGAAQAVLTAFLSPQAPAPIALTSPADPGVTRTYTNWQAITQEVIDARVWEGVHFRFSDVIGAKEGAQVAVYDLSQLARLQSQGA